MVSKNKYQPVIGLEIHIELSTDSSMFCGCPTDHFAKKPNTNVCPVCLGLPGALPVPNIKAIQWTLFVGLALGCSINKTSKFDRKHYNYPDLPKGYQISQYDMPIAIGGSLKFPISNSPTDAKAAADRQFSNREVNITRVHLEEDTGKLLHRKIDGKDVSLVDFNRSGVPLLEIVTEPDLCSAKETAQFAKELQRIVRFLGVSGCDMEKGSLRLEVNISLAKNGKRKTKSEMKLPGYKVEIKNLNSFKFVQKAIDYEIARQTDMLNSGKTPRQETRGWNEKEKKTVHQRFKETDDDYRYFPEPDIPPIVFTDKEIKALEKRLPKLPNAYREDFEKLGVKASYTEQLIINREQADGALKIINDARKKNIDANDVASVIVNKKLDLSKMSVSEVIKMAKNVKSSGVKDSAKLEQWVNDTIKSLPQAASDYKSGKESAISALVGGVMKVSKGKADPATTKEILITKLS